MITTLKPDIKHYMLMYIPTGDTYLATKPILSDAMEEACRKGPCLTLECKNCPWFNGTSDHKYTINIIEALYLLEEI